MVSRVLIQANTPFMSSNLRIVMCCAFCKQEFIARKTTTKPCSDPCAKRLYKLRLREQAIRRAKIETMVKRIGGKYIHFRIGKNCNLRGPGRMIYCL